MAPHRGDIATMAPHKQLNGVSLSERRAKASTAGSPKRLFSSYTYTPKQTYMYTSTYNNSNNDNNNNNTSNFRLLSKLAGIRHKIA